MNWLLLSKSKRAGIGVIFLALSSMLQAEHLVVLQPGQFFNLSGLVSPEDKISWVATKDFNVEEAENAETSYQKGSICVLSEKSEFSGERIRLDEFELRIPEIESCIAEIEKKEGKVDLVIGNLENTLLPASIINKKRGNPYLASEIIEVMRDKLKMKEILKETNNVKYPLFSDVGNDNSVETRKAALDFASKIGYPLIIKPKNQAGSLGVKKITDSSELISYLENRDLDIEVQMEEFIEAPILHIDGLVRDDELVFLSSAKYVNNCLKWLEEKCPFGSVVQTDELIAKNVTEFTSKVIKNFGLEDGVFHLEAFLHEDKSLTFLEITPRFGGGHAVPLYINKYGINIAKEGLLALRGLDSELTEKDGGYVNNTCFIEKSTESVACVMFPSEFLGEVEITKVNLPENLKTIIKSSIPRIGQIINVPASNVYFSIANFWLKGDEEIINDEIERLSNGFKIEYRRVHLGK